MEKNKFSNLKTKTKCLQHTKIELKNSIQHCTRVNKLTKEKLKLDARN